MDLSIVGNQPTSVLAEGRGLMRDDVPHEIGILVTPTLTLVAYICIVLHADSLA